MANREPQNDRSPGENGSPPDQNDRRQVDNPNDSQTGGKGGSNFPALGMGLVSWLLTGLVVMYLWSGAMKPSTVSVPYSRFKTELLDDNVAEVSVKDNAIQGKFRSSIAVAGRSSDSFIDFKTRIPNFGDPELLPLLEKNKVTVAAVSSETESVWLGLLVTMLPWLLIIGFFIYSSRMLRGGMSGGVGGAFSFGKSKARHYGADTVSVKYSDVAGLDNAKRDLQEIIQFLKDPQKFLVLGAKMPKGILMMGPPGCGKTLLAKATAGEAGVPFFSVSGSEFIEMYVGVGASRVRDMFTQARKEAPALIFIDEIDSIGRVRGTGLGGGHDEREQTLNQILAEMDGFASDDPVVVLAATNRPDVLDPALLRPGRFDRKLVLELPHREARKAILSLHAKKTPLAEDVDLEALAAVTVGFSGADLANLVNEAALHAARKNKTKVDREDFDRARDKVILGDESGACLTDEERQRVAYHEAGHALTALHLPNADPIKRITIIPRGRSLGATEQIPTEDRHNYNQAYLEARLCILLGGRCAEQIHFHDVSSGAADDLKQATQLARQMVTQWGMSKTIGPVNYQQGEMHPFLGKEITEAKQFSEKAAEQIDAEISHFIKDAEAKTQALLAEYSAQLSRLAEALLTHESLDSDEIEQLLAA